MGDTSFRIFAVILLLVGVWIATYWLYEPPRPVVTRDTALPAGLVLAPPSATQLNPSSSALIGSTSPAASPAELNRLPVVPEPKLAPGPRVRVPRFQDYIVQTGDVSWKAIAARPQVYGDPSLWQAVSRANPMVTPDRLKPGRTVLRIPIDPNNIQGELLSVDQGASASLSPVPVPTSVNPNDPAPASPAPKTYVVTNEDTLWLIAKKVYGKGSAWRQVYEANRDVIKDPDRPPVGATLRVPVLE